MHRLLYIFGKLIWRWHSAPINMPFIAEKRDFVAQLDAHIIAFYQSLAKIVQTKIFIKLKHY